MAGILDRLDAQLDELFHGWNYLSTAIALVVALYVLYPVIFSREPDTHPLLLTRQANISAIRQPGESAVYRSLEVPHGYPLKSGLHVKAPGAPKWASGKDGDVRDVWRSAVSGAVSQTGEATGKRGTIITVRGTEQVKTHDLDAISVELNVIGTYLKQKGAVRVGVYLPNSVELLTAVLAGSFYGFRIVLVPYDKPKHVVLKILKQSEVDILIGTAGSLPSDDLFNQCPKLKEVTWVVEETSRDVDWTEPDRPVSTWHEIVDPKKNETSSELPANSQDDVAPEIITIRLDDGPDGPISGEIIAFTQKNIVAAVAAQVTALPIRQRITVSDLFLPADALTVPYILVTSLAALLCNASLALNSVAGSDVPIPVAAQGLAPTIIVASSAQAFNLHDATKRSIGSAAKKYALSTQTKALRSGVMPASTLATRLIVPVAAKIGTAPGSLRLLYVFDKINADAPPMASARLSDLRAFTGARVIYALTTGKVAGPFAQTTFYDYRREDEDESPAHFGVPPSCLEIQLVDKGEFKTEDVNGGTVRGEILVRGPAVQDGEARLGVIGQIRDDGCLKYLFQYPENAAKPT